MFCSKLHTQVWSTHKPAAFKATLSRFAPQFEGGAGRPYLPRNPRRPLPAPTPSPPQRNPAPPSHRPPHPPPITHAPVPACRPLPPTPPAAGARSLPARRPARSPTGIRCTGHVFLTCSRHVSQACTRISTDSAPRSRMSKTLSSTARAASAPLLPTWRRHPPRRGESICCETAPSSSTHFRRAAHSPQLPNASCAAAPAHAPQRIRL